MTEFEIGSWTFNPEYRRFSSRKDKEFFLEERLSKLFIVLFEQKGMIVKRDVLIETVWKEVRVNEESLTKGIFDLRKILVENKIPLKIKTIRNLGYQLKINERALAEKPNYVKPLLKFLFYLFAILGFSIMLIRAIKYGS